MNSGSNGTSEKVVPFYRTEYSKQKFVFHFFKAIVDTSFKSSNWFAANRLSLNLSKTNFMVFKPWQKKQSFEFQVSMNEQSIIRVSETIFVGVFLDDNLTWKPHISLLASKLSKSNFNVNFIYFWKYNKKIH